MKIQLIQDVIQASTNLRFYKGRIYNAIPATNQPRAIRLIKQKTDISINKVFAEKKEGSILLDQNDFVIIDFSKKEKANLIEEYKQSKIKTPREKRVAPKGLKLREGFRPFLNEKEQTDKLFHCSMGTYDGPCNKTTKYVKVFGRIKVARCLKHATIPENA